MPIAIVLPLPAEVAARVALPSHFDGVLAPEELHLTIAALRAPPPAGMLDALRSLAARTPRVNAALSGVGRFAAPAPEREPFYLSVDAPVLVGLRAEVTALVGDLLDTTHGFTPHVTLAYFNRDSLSPIERIDLTPVAFEALALWDGDTRTTFPLMPSPMLHLDAIELSPDARIPPREIRLFRDGWNDTTKGRFLLDAEAVASILRAFTAHGVDLAMDFDHGTFTDAPGMKRDVPGYIGRLEHRPGDGLYATDIRWTAVGLKAISPGVGPDGQPTVPEYRYVSPAILFDEETRRLTSLGPVALVSFPATVGQRPLVMSHQPRKEPRTTMKNVIAFLGLSADADESAVLTVVQSARRECDALLGALGASDLPSALGKITALGSARTELDAAQKRATDAEGRIEAAERRELLAAGKAAGKLTPALEKLYADKPVAELRAFLDAAPVVAALASKVATQSATDALPAGVAGVPDKPFEQLSALEKDRLLRANRLAFEQSLAQFEARGGNGARYRAALARV